MIVAVALTACNDNTQADEKVNDTVPVMAVPVDTPKVKADTSAVITDTSTVK